MKSKIVCLCNFVTENEIQDLLRKGATSVAEIQLMTRAGTTCGRCLSEVESIAVNYRNHNPGNLQAKIQFD